MQDLGGIFSANWESNTSFITPLFETTGHKKAPEKSGGVSCKALMVFSHCFYRLPVCWLLSLRGLSLPFLSSF